MPSTTPKAKTKSPRVKPWLIIGDMRYGTKRTEDTLNKRAAFILANYYLYHPEAKDKRLSIEYYEYKMIIFPKEVAFALEISLRKAQRMFKLTREKLHKDKNALVGVSEFCKLHKLDERKIRMLIVPPPKK